MYNIEAVITLFFALCIALISGLARADLSKADLALVEKATEQRQLQPAELDKAIERLEKLEKEAGKPDEKISGELARMLFFKADTDDDSNARIKKYQKAIDAAEKALAVNENSVLGNFWYAAAVGKQGLDIGITRALKNAKPMRDHLEKLLKIDEKYEHAGPHRALARLYVKVPRWPISFGDKKKALEHARKAAELDPQFQWNQVYLAEALIANDKEKEAKPILEKVIASSKPGNFPQDYQRWMKESRELLKKTE